MNTVFLIGYSVFTDLQVNKRTIIEHWKEENDTFDINTVVMLVLSTT